MLLNEMDNYGGNASAGAMQSRRTYEVEWIILDVLSKRGGIRRRDLYKEVEFRHSFEHGNRGKELSQSMLSEGLKTLMMLNFAETSMDKTDGRIRGVRPTFHGNVLYNGIKLVGNTLMDSGDFFKGYYAHKLHRGILDHMKYYLYRGEKQEEEAKNEKIVLDLIKEWGKQTKHRSGKAEISELRTNCIDFLSIFFSVKLNSVMKKVGIPLEEQAKPAMNSGTIVNALQNGDIDLAINIPLSAIENSNLRYYDFVALPFPITACDILMLDEEGYERVRKEKRIDIYYTEGMARSTLANWIGGEKMHEKDMKEAVEGFIENVNGGVGLITESPFLASFLEYKLNMKRDRKIRIMSYIEPLFLVLNNESGLSGKELDKIANMVENAWRHRNIFIDIYKALTTFEEEAGYISPRYTKITQKYSTLLASLEEEDV